MSEGTANIIIRKVKIADVSEVTDTLAVEEPLEIALAYYDESGPLQKVVSVTMRTPGNDRELAAGFLFTEGIINSADQLKAVIAPEENKITVALHKDTRPVLQKAERNFYTTSSCGVCGKTSIDAVKTVSPFAATADALEIDAAVLYSLPEKLREQQVTFNSTGGLHASALFDLQGNFMMLREDVGRHNALDKLIGAALQSGTLPLQNHILLLSGRASFELIQKATMAGIKIVAAIGAPSTLAVQAAEEAGITLAGFLRNGSFNIYTKSKRIIIKQKA